MLCHRELTDVASVQRGYGDDCQKKYETYLAACGTTLQEIAVLSLHEDEAVRRWAVIAGRAIRSGGRRWKQDAALFIENARRTAREPQRNEVSP